MWLSFLDGPYELLGGLKKNMFTPILGEMIQFDEHILQMGGKKPPTRLYNGLYYVVCHVFFHIGHVLHIAHASHA